MLLLNKTIMKTTYLFYTHNTLSLSPLSFSFSLSLLNNASYKLLLFIYFMNDSKYATSSADPVKNGTRWCTCSGSIFNTLPVPLLPAPPACSGDM